MILLIGALAVLAALLVEIVFAPPSWVHLIYQVPLVLGGSVGLLRPFKATLIALQFRHHGHDFET